MRKRGNDRLTALMGVLAWKTAARSADKGATRDPELIDKLSGLA